MVRMAAASQAVETIRVTFCATKNCLFELLGSAEETQRAFQTVGSCQKD